MSYQYPPQAQPAYQPPQQPLRWPTHQLMNPLLQLNYGQPPVLPNIAYLPTPLQPFYPLIVSACIDAIQAKAQNSPLRIFFTNQMAENNYNNPEFTAFVEGLVRFLDMRMSKGVYRDVPSGATDAAIMYSELNTAANVMKYPALAGQIDPQMMQGVHYVLGELRKITDEMQRYTASLQQGGYQPPPVQMQPYGQPQPAQQSWQQPAPPAYTPQPAYQPPPAYGARPVNWRQPPPPQAISPVSHGTQGPIFQSGPVSTVTAVPSADVDRFSRFYSPYDEDPPAPAVDVVSHAQIVQDMRRSKETTMVISTLPTATVLPPNIVKASDGTVEWKPSMEASVNIAFDPNTTDLYYIVNPDGTTKPVIKEKEQTMDMSKHLITPTYAKPAPQGLNGLDTNVRAFEMDKALAEDAQTASQQTPLQLNVAYKDQSFNSGLSLTELWFGNDVKLATMRKKENKVNLYRSCAVLTEPVVSEKNPKPFLDTLLSAESFVQANAMLRTAQSLVNQGTHPNLDARLLSVINKRLTHRFNEFMKKQLAVTTGWVDSFMEDIVDVLPHVEKRYGDIARKGVVENQKKIIRQALTYAEPDFEKTQNATYLPDETTDEGKEASKLNITYFYTYVTLTTLDLFSTELKLEIPATEVAVGVFEKQTPLMRHIAENIFTHEKALDMEFGRHLIQTADQVVVEVSRSVMHADFYLVAVV
jgi:hypothetical protein